ncbi:uncharacterized protein LDX57_001358 [Aspergillus melleus]|uniref:uncharacterized protein n=1 Tax=Aspergillus melleus TaxID=138277 RepID=UPI001E8ED1B2|nr:uncharacterized protein LDX57_001358 [Aspergillus melleus]KAH8423598.1 hypothetical protein LDX57_001358 [Aspergillus melleus]
MSRFKSRPHPPPQDILTPGPDLPWELVGPGESYLLVELEKLYWAGVERELKNIIQTLRVWRRPEYSYISIPDETDDFIYGFDTFIDQVCQESREFALRYGKRRRREDADKPSAILGQDHKSEYALKQAFLDNKAERNSMRIRGEVRAEIENLPQLEGLELRAAMLLQSAGKLFSFRCLVHLLISIPGFLDIDKITEYRPPRDKSRPRPGIPQLTLTINEHSQPEFHPLHCSACNAIIYDSMFARQPFVPKPYTICSDCYWAQHYSDPAFVKVHKHSVLHAIDTSTSGRLCKCESVPHFDSSGRSRSLFPLNPNDRHITSGKDRCPLLDLAGMVSHAKYRGLLSSIGMKPQGSESGSVGRMIERVKSIKLGKADRKNNASQVGTGHLRDMDHTAGPPAEDDIPAFFRHRTENNPFGDEHMALRVGPLVIENGVESTKSGALITLRNPPVFHERFEHAASQPALMVDGTPERLLWQQSNRLVSQPKRYKTMMKQVVGVPFSGLVRSKQDQELEILKLVVEASQSATASSESDLQQDLDSRISRILDQLQDLLLPRVRVYLSSIASQLLNPSTTLTWNPTSNTCHSFCTSLLDPTLFTPLVNGPPKNPDTNTNPLYLISFYTPPPQPNQHPLTQTPTPIPRTKHDIPPGHIQEFLIQPSTSPSSNLIDSLTHYSTD